MYQSSTTSDEQQSRSRAASSRRQTFDVFAKRILPHIYTSNMDFIFHRRRSLNRIRSVTILIILGTFVLNSFSQSPPNKSQRARAREIGVQVGTTQTGKWNAITDVPGIKVGHTTLHQGKDIHTGVTVILPHGDDVFQQKAPASIVVGNGYGKLAGSTQVTELGNIETPIALTSTLSVGPVMNSLVRYTLDLPGNENVRSVNAVVGETNDGYLNDIREFRITEEHVFEAIRTAKSGPVEEGSVGAGAGTQCFGFKGGIGTSSRIVTTRNGQSFTLGVLVQTNFGNKLKINGAPIGDTPAALKAARKQPEGDGSCMIIVATDAPISVRNIGRIARRALHGMARTGSSMSNGSGDYVIAFSTAYRIPHRETEMLKNSAAPTQSSYDTFFCGSNGCD
jgi:D-aminopeptidase